MKLTKTHNTNMKGKRATTAAAPSKPRNGETKNDENLGKNIRNLVKNVSNSKTQNPSPDISAELPREIPDGDSYARRKPPRRRGQARKPYQDNIVDMAEARREIVTALKLHRESMKQGRRPGPETELLGPASHHFSSADQQEAAAGLKSRRSPRIYASSCNYVSNTTNYAYPHPPPPPPPGLYYSQPVWSFGPPPPLYVPPENDHLNNLVLPSQTLGLNLNLQGFSNYLDTSSFLCSASANNNNNSSSISSSSPSDYCSPAPLSGEITYMAEDPASEIGNVLDIGVSDGRAEFLGPDQDDFGVSLEFPAWVNNADESCVTHDHHLLYGSGDAFFQDPALPRMDIEEIEGMDDWLA